MTSSASPSLPIGNAVRVRRLELGLSQVDLAERVGVSQPALSALESGRTLAGRPSTVKRVAAALGCTVAELRAGAQ